MATQDSAVDYDGLLSRLADPQSSLTCPLHGSRYLRLHRCFTSRIRMVYGRATRMFRDSQNSWPRKPGAKLELQRAVTLQAIDAAYHGCGTNTAI